MNIKKLIESRFSVRNFLEKKVDTSIIINILETANKAPSGGNIQPWNVYVLNKKSKNKLISKALKNYNDGIQEKVEYEIYPKPLEEKYRLRRSQCASDMYKALSIERNDINKRLDQIKENFKFFGAPTAMIITIDKSFSKNGWGHVGMFLQNLWLLAVNEGLGMCLQESWSIYPQTVRSVIKHPNNEIVWCGIALGYPNPDHPINNYKTSREPIDSFVKFVN